MQRDDNARPDSKTAHALCLSKLLREDDVDAAIEAGLMDFTVSGMDDADHRQFAAAVADIAAAQARLSQAWAARERHDARKARLQRRADERAARRASMRETGTGKPALPPAAAAALARAKARAAGKA